MKFEVKARKGTESDVCIAGEQHGVHHPPRHSLAAPLFATDVSVVHCWLSVWYTGYQCDILVISVVHWLSVWYTGN